MYGTQGTSNITTVYLDKENFETFAVAHRADLWRDPENGASFFFVDQIKIVQKDDQCEARTS